MLSKSQGEPRVAVVTVNYGSESVLGSFLSSVNTATIHPVAVVVADNKPSQASAGLASAYGSAHLALPANPGYGGAVNAAVATLPPSIDWILVANPDVVLDESAIDTLVDAGDADSHIGSLGPAVRNPDGTLYPSARRVPSLRVGIGHALFAGIWPSNPWTRRYHEQSLPTRRDAGWLSGSCVLIRRSAFDAIGGFDPDYFMYFEDVDLGYRLGRAGYRNVYEPGATATHSGGHSTRQDSAAMVEAHHQSAKRFVSRKYPGPALGPIRFVISVGLRVRARLISRNL